MSAAFDQLIHAADIALFPTEVSVLERRILASEFSKLCLEAIGELRCHISDPRLDDIEFKAKTYNQNYGIIHSLCRELRPIVTKAKAKVDAKQEKRKAIQTRREKRSLYSGQQSGMF